MKNRDHKPYTPNWEQRDAFSEMEDFGYWGGRYAALFRGIAWMLTKVFYLTVTLLTSISRAISKKPRPKMPSKPPRTMARGS